MNRTLAARILENEEVDDEKKDADYAKKTSKKKKGLSSDVLKDERFAAMFENKVKAFPLLIYFLYLLFPNS